MKSHFEISLAATSRTTSSMLSHVTVALTFLVTYTLTYNPTPQKSKSSSDTVDMPSNSKACEEEIRNTSICQDGVFIWRSTNLWRSFFFSISPFIIITAPPNPALWNSAFKKRWISHLRATWCLRSSLFNRMYRSNVAQDQDKERCAPRTVCASMTVRMQQHPYSASGWGWLWQFWFLKSNGNKILSFRLPVATQILTRVVAEVTAWKRKSPQLENNSQFDSSPRWKSRDAVLCIESSPEWLLARCNTIAKKGHRSSDNIDMHLIWKHAWMTLNASIWQDRHSHGKKCQSWTKLFLLCVPSFIITAPLNPVF